MKFLISFIYLQGGDHIELIPNGGDIEVNASNIYDYVRKYAEFRMVKLVSKPLEVLHFFETLFVCVCLALILDLLCVNKSD